MSKPPLEILFVLGVVGCAASKPIVAGSDPDPLQAEVAELKEQVARLQSQVGHLQGEISAASAENELAEMTIDSVVWAEDVALQISSDTPTLLCHVKEWRGWGKMLRFTRKADQSFVLEADGHPPIWGTTGEGGICSDDGSTRFVILRLEEDLAPNVAYNLWPQNTKKDYRWSVTDGLVVRGR